MQIEVTTCSFKGGRACNEDSVNYIINNDVCVVMVADGLGGHGSGHVASAAVTDYIIQTFINNPILDPMYIYQLFEEANVKVLNIQTFKKKMKSTGAALFLINNTAVWGHIGDTRVYHFKDRKLINQTLDHSVSQMAVFAREIKQEQIRGHEDRNKILKAFGGFNVLKPEISPFMVMDNGFHAFLLCTDGFWEYVWEDEMESDLCISSTPDDWLNSMLKRLEQRAPEDNDNYTAAAIFLRINNSSGEEE